MFIDWFILGNTLKLMKESQMIHGYTAGIILLGKVLVFFSPNYTALAVVYA